MKQIEKKKQRKRAEQEKERNFQVQEKQAKVRKEISKCKLNESWSCVKTVTETNRKELKKITTKK